MSKILEKFQNYIQSKKQHEGTPFIPYEYCTRCEANLTLQKGFDPTLPYWICLGCGEMLINPASYVNKLIKRDEGVVNKTFVKMLEALGYDIELHYVKRNTKEEVSL